MLQHDPSSWYLRINMSEKYEPIFTPNFDDILCCKALLAMAINLNSYTPACFAKQLCRDVFLHL